MSESLHKTQVGRRLREAIEALGISQAEVGHSLDVSPSKLGNWLRGDNYPAAWFVVRFCDRYGVTTEWLYRGIVTGLPATLADALWKAEQAARHDEPTERPKGRKPPDPFAEGNATENNRDDGCAATNVRVLKVPA